MKKLVLIGFVTIAVLVTAVMSSRIYSVKNTQTERVEVLTSIYPITYIARSVGGEKIGVTQVVPDGIEPHDYELTPDNLRLIESGNLLIINGEIESWAKDIKNTLVVGTPLMNLKYVDEGKESTDPHVWTNPLNMIKMTAKITEKFIELDPANTSYYKDNSSELITKLDKLDSDMREYLANCETRTIVTSHAAFGYLANRYNLKQVEISGLSSEDEPSARRISEIVDTVRREKIDYVFFESLTSNKLANTIANETNTMVLELNPIEGLSEEDLSSGQDYIAIQNRNLGSLVKALKCD